MYTSDPPRKTSARNPSHLGSYRKAPVGSSSASFASIGSIGGSTANILNSQRSTLDDHRSTLRTGDRPIASCAQPAPRRGAPTAIPLQAQQQASKRDAVQ